MAGGVSFALGLIAVVFVQHATAAATVHVVGDTTGWTIPPSPTFYSEWAAKQHVAVGDSLKFDFGTGAHDVAKVSKDAFMACNPDEPIGNVMTNGPATVKIDTAGEHYFICTVGKHCAGGQKVQVTAGGAAGPKTSNTTNTTASAPTTAPGPTTAATPSTNDSSAASPADKPAEKSPSSSPTDSDGEATDASAPSPSSSAAVMATLYLTLSAIVMSFLF